MVAIVPLYRELFGGEMILSMRIAERASVLGCRLVRLV
jgi:hypothetical protein